MKVTFKITPATVNNIQHQLLVEACDSELSFLIYSKNPFTIVGIYKLELNKNISDSEYVAAISKFITDENILNDNYSSKHLIYNFSTSSLVPVKYFLESEKENLLSLMFGENNSSLTFQENTVDSDIKNVYRVNAVIYDTFNNLFPSNKFVHASSNQIVINKYSEDVLECIVYTNFIKLLLFKDGKLQIVQYFDYETPLDVSYYLLNVCQQFGISPKEVKLALSGMIEIKSTLYDDIYKYFLNVHFVELVTDIIFTEEMKIMPNHFYNNLIEQALCV